MADNTVLNPGVGGDTYASDDIGGVKHQRVKISIGADGAATDCSTANPLPISDAGGSLTVDGTVAVSGTVPVSDAGGSLTVDNAGTFAVQASLSASIPAGTNNIGDVDIASIAAGDNNIGNVDVVTVPADPFGTNADAASASGSISAKLRQIATNGIPITGTVTVGSHAVTNAGTFAVQAVAAGAAAENAAVSGNPVLVGGRYDSTPRTLGNGDVGGVALNASGQVLVEIAAGAGSGGTAMADGATFTRNTTSLTPVGAVVETSAPTLTNGDVAGLSQTPGGALRVAVASGGIAGVLEDAPAAGGEEGIMILGVRRDTPASGVSADGDFTAFSFNSSGALYVTGGGGGTQYNVDDVAGGTNTGTLSLAVRDDALSTLTPADGDYTQLRTNARGAQWVALDSTVAQNVTVAAAIPAGTNNIGDVDVLTLPNVTLAAGTNTNEVVGDAAHDAAIAGNPVRIAGRAMSADFTAVATGDTTDILASLLGKQVTLPYSLPGASWSYAAASGGITGTTAVTVKAAAGAGVRNYVTSCQVINGHATVSTEVLIRDGASGTVLHRGFAQAAGGGYTCKFEPPLRGTANTLLEVVNVTTGSATYVNLQGFAAAE